MLSQILDQEIQNFCTRVQQTNPLFINAAAGKLTPAHVRRYVAGLHQLVTHTLTNIRLAADESKRRQDAALADHFEHKFAEEVGHHEWADEDISNIDKKFAAAKKDVVASSPSIVNIIEYNQATIKREPRLYLIYMLLAEYATVLGGPNLMELLQTRCGITPDMLSIVGNHVVLDKEHVQEGFAEIDRFISRADDDVSIASLHQAMKLLEDFFTEVGTVH